MIEGIVTAEGEADSPPLLGMRLMQGYRILIEDIEGGSVRLERL